MLDISCIYHYGLFMFRLQRNQKKAYYENLRKGDEEANVQLFEAMNVKDNTVAKAPEPQPVSFAVCYLILSDALVLISSLSVVCIQCCAPFQETYISVRYT